MSDRSRYYLLGAFLAGAALSAAWNNYSAKGGDEKLSDEERLQQQQKIIAQLAKSNNLQELRKGLEDVAISIQNNVANIKDGVEGCIGDTPLIRIKSLSEATGCEILAKAEAGNIGSIRRSIC